MRRVETEVQGQFAPLVAAIRYGALGLVAVTVVSLIAWTAVAGTSGLWGALVGAGVGGAFILTTVVTMYATRHVSPTTTGAILLGGWLLKIVVAIIVMAVLGGMDFYDRAALAVTIVAALVVMLAAEATAIARTRTPYVAPVADAPAEQAPDGTSQNRPAESEGEAADAADAADETGRTDGSGRGGD